MVKFDVKKAKRFIILDLSLVLFIASSLVVVVAAGTCIALPRYICRGVYMHACMLAWRKRFTHIGENTERVDVRRSWRGTPRR